MGSNYNPHWIIVVLAALGFAVGAAVASTVARAADAQTWVWFRNVPDGPPWYTGAFPGDWAVLGLCALVAGIVMYQSSKL